MSLPSENLEQYLNSMATKLNELQEQLTQTQAQANQAQAEAAAAKENLARASAVIPEKEPKLPLPEKYTGSRADFRSFLNACKLFMNLRPGQFRDHDRAKVGFVMSLLKDTALDWASPYMERDDPVMYSWDAFEKAFQAMFDDPHRSRTAAMRLSSIAQGSRSVVSYAAEFRRTALDTSFDDTALCHLFREGLADTILDELVHHPAKDNSLTEFIAQCTLLDTRLMERKAERHRRNHLRRAMPLAQQPPAGDPMVIDGAPILPAGPPNRGPRGPLPEAERQRRRDNGLCMYCGDAGHMINECPRRRPRRPENPEGQH